MNAPDVESFLNRDWKLIERIKTNQWVAQKAAMSSSEAIQLADELRRYARTIRPDWPNSAERNADFASHSRVAEILHHAAQNGAR